MKLPLRVETYTHSNGEIDYNVVDADGHGIAGSYSDVSFGKIDAPLVVDACNSVGPLRAALKSLLAAIPDTRALLVAREDAKAALGGT